MPPLAQDTETSSATPHDYTVSLNHVMDRFNAEGIGRTKRRLAELCQRGVLEGKKFKTTHGETWFVTQASLDAAVQQIKTEERLAAAAAGDSKLEPGAASASRLARSSEEPPHQEQMTPRDTDARPATVNYGTMAEPAGAGARRRQPADGGPDSGLRQGSQPDLSSVDIFSHPYVIKIEQRNEQLEKKLDDQIRRTETIQREAFDRLVELQRSSQIAQSQTLADFFIKTRDYLLGRSANAEPGNPN